MVNQIEELMRRATNRDRDERLAVARYRARSRKGVSVLAHHLEPQSRRMPDADRDRFQTAVSEQMATFSRAPFSGPVALKIDLATTGQNAPQAHTIVKNLLDLLGKRRAGVPGKHRHLLYKDDSQIEALSVSCRHGEDYPMIHVAGRPLSALLGDMEFAAEAIRADEMENYENVYRREQEEEAIEDLRELMRDEREQRERMGDDLYEAYHKMLRWSAQRALLERSGIDIPVLAWMYGRPKGATSILQPDQWAQLIGQSKLRLQLGDLPITPAALGPLSARLRKRLQPSSSGGTGSSIRC